MAEQSPWRLLVPRQLRALPPDLTAIGLVAILTILAVTLPVVRETPVRIVLGLPFVLFVPGYALVAALFPEAGEGPRGGVERGTESEERADGDHASRFPVGDGRGVDGIERVALSFGLSIAVVPLLGLVLNFTPWGIRLGPILVAVGGFTLLTTAVAARRRWALPVEERFAVPYRAWLAAGREELFSPETRTDAALNVVLVASILVAVGSVGFAIAVPSDGESFSELYYLTETDDGALIADDYPTEFVAGEARPIVVGVGNQEHERTNYTVVVELQNVTLGNGTSPGDLARENRSRAANGSSGVNATSVTVHEREELARYGATLAHNRTHHRTVQLRPTMVGDDRRMQFFLYRGTAPADPSTATAYRDVHLWVNVSNDGS